MEDTSIHGRFGHDSHILLSTYSEAVVTATCQCQKAAPVKNWIHVIQVILVISFQHLWLLIFNRFDSAIFIYFTFRSVLHWNVSRMFLHKTIGTDNTANEYIQPRFSSFLSVISARKYGFHTVCLCKNWTQEIAFLHVPCGLAQHSSFIHYQYPIISFITPVEIRTSQGWPFTVSFANHRKLDLVVRDW